MDDERHEIEEREEQRERLEPNHREQKDMFVKGRSEDDEGRPVFHPLNVHELDQRRRRRGVSPSDGKDAA